MYTQKVVGPRKRINLALLPIVLSRLLEHGLQDMIRLKKQRIKMIIVKANSSRARNRLFVLYPFARNNGFYPLDFSKKIARGHYWIPDNLLSDALKIPGITKVRNQNRSDYGLCW